MGPALVDRSPANAVPCGAVREATVLFDLSDLSLDFLIRDNHRVSRYEDVKGKGHVG